MPEVFALLPKRRPWWHLRRTGLFFGAVYVLISMSPSLLPRTWYYQGLITGLCWWVGYGLGVLLFWLAHHLARLVGLRVYLSARAIRWLRMALPAFFAVGIATATVANVRAQAHTASVVGLAPLSPLDWALALGLAAVIALGLLAVVRGLRRLRQALTDVVDHVLPKSVSAVLAAVVVVTGTAWVSDNVIFRRAMQVMAASAAQVNADNPSGRPAPTSPLRTGGPGTTEAYATLGFEGQMFVTSAPAESEIAAATGRPALDPIRAYAGRPDERSLTEVAAAVVAELKRTGAFDRKVLAVVTTTGTGWVDDYAVQSVEYLSDGDCATAAMQYSFLPSALQVLTDRDTPRAAGKALFDAVYAEWVRRPAATRPRLVVGGESLGSFGGQGAFTGADDMMARAQGGVWAGTPSFTDIWSKRPHSPTGRRLYAFALRDEVPAPEGGWTVVRHPSTCVSTSEHFTNEADCPLADTCRLFVFEGERRGFTSGMDDLMEVVSIFTGEKTDRSLGRHPEAGRRVVAVVGGPLDGDEDQATHYERSMQLLHDAVKALRLATGAHTPDVTIERVWPLYMVLNERDEGGFDPGNLIIVEDGWATTPTASPAKTNEAQALLTAIWSSDPVEIYRDFHLGARRAGETDGDYTECVLKAATAAEVLIKHTAWMLTWEATEKRPSDPAPGAKTMPPTGETKPSQLVGQVLAARLGGNWSSQREDQPIGAWRHAIAQMRNQILHLGHRPKHQEARDALTALTLLEQHVLDRIAERAEKYPITALFLAGEEGLERRGARAKVRATLRDHDLQELKSGYRAWLQVVLQKDSEELA